MFPVRITGEAPDTDRAIATRPLDDGAGAVWRIPEETPVAFVYNRRNYAVMLATPQDIVDFATGFSLTERVVDTVEGIRELGIHYTDRGVDLRIGVARDYLERLDVRQRRRNLAGASGCGVCGLDNADALFAPMPQVDGAALDGEAVTRAIAALAGHQPINERTRSIHAAGWVGFDGVIRSVREDVGRHNALDKLLGGLALAGADMTDGFVLMSSRCSYELVEKAARRGVRALVSISGPTGFAVSKAREAGMKLYARSGSGAVELCEQG